MCLVLKGNQTSDPEGAFDRFSAPSGMLVRGPMKMLKLHWIDYTQTALPLNVVDPCQLAAVVRNE
jgi:hypothetical protein